jgi:ATP-dependent Clp protease protease subunit
MIDGNEFRKYATKHIGINSMVVDHYIESSLTPYIIEERPMNMTQMDVFSRLMMDRIIFLGTGINDQVANIINAQLLFLESVDAKKDIQIYQMLLQFVQEWRLLWEQFFYALVLMVKEVL